MTGPEGMQAKAIGRRLAMSPSTVQAHRNSAYRKLGVFTAAGAVARCLQAGWFDDPKLFPGTSLPEETVQEYLRKWEHWLRTTDDGRDFCFELLARIGRSRRSRR